LINKEQDKTGVKTKRNEKLPTKGSRPVREVINGVVTLGQARWEKRSGQFLSHREFFVGKVGDAFERSGEKRK